MKRVRVEEWANPLHPSFGPPSCPLLLEHSPVFSVPECRALVLYVNYEHYYLIAYSKPYDIFFTIAFSNAMRLLLFRIRVKHHYRFENLTVDPDPIMTNAIIQHNLYMATRSSFIIEESNFPLSITLSSVEDIFFHLREQERYIKMIARAPISIKATGLFVVFFKNSSKAREHVAYIGCVSINICFHQLTEISEGFYLLPGPGFAPFNVIAQRESLLKLSVGDSSMLYQDFIPNLINPTSIVMDRPRAVRVVPSANV